MSDNNLSERREQLSAAKRALLEKRLKGQSAAVSADTPPQTAKITPRPADAPTEASPGQARIWSFQQLHPHSTAYNMSMAYRVVGPLNFGALSRSVNAVIARHDSLRTTFQMEDGRLMQRIPPELILEVKTLDLTQTPAAEREQLAMHRAEGIFNHRFDLEEGPLLRVFVLRLTSEQSILIVVIHHIISDEWSNSNLWRELATFYTAFTTNQPANLPDLPLRYTDYAYWQHRQLTSSVIEAQTAYWKTQLADSPALIQLPADRPRPPRQTYRGGLAARQLAPELSARLRTLSRQQDVTLFTLLLTAYAVLLHRYTGQGDLLIGTPVANRKHAELEHVIGFFLNTLAVRVRFDDVPTYIDLLAQVRKTVLDAVAHQDVPFDRLVEVLRPPRDPSYHPIFQTMFVLQDQETIPALPGVDLTPIPTDLGVAKFDLTLFVADTGTDIQLTAEYNSDLFDEATIQRLLGHLQTLLESIAAQPEALISHLNLLPGEEREQIVREWNATDADFPETKCIHDFLSEQAAAAPNAVAVIHHDAQARDTQLTYRELDARSDQVAHYLRAEGVAAGSIIGICMLRTPEVLVAMYGVLKAGCAYVPLDPDYPQERIEHITAEVAMPLLLTQQQLIAQMPQTSARMIAIDADWPQIEAAEPPSTPVEVDSSSLAYVIYTSGSTGQPKGVPITHRNLVHSTTARFSYYPRSPERFLLLSSFAFDSSVVGIYWTLSEGGALCLPAQGEEKNADGLIRLIQGLGITHMLCLPSLYAILLDFTSAEQLSSLKTVIVAGEACPPTVVESHFAAVPAAELYNEYGPTEGTVWSTAHALSPADADMVVPIGRPISNMRTYILDAQRQPVPIGVAGELYIAGAGLADGYFRRPDLTAERFVQTALDEAVLYRTGDLARYLPDGSIVFLGRVDHQVKVRGYRVELEEIEAVLLQHPQVQQTVVLSISDAAQPTTDSRLIAFVQLEAAADQAAVDLRALLATRLPEYMIPAQIFALETFPLTPNGKIDRLALEQHAHDSPQTTKAITAPRDSTEEQLADLWREMLGLQTIGVDDNFFDLGGHSLLAMRVIARINREFEISLPPASFLQAPTVAGVAERIKRGQNVEISSLVVPLQPDGDRPIFWALATYRGDVFTYRALAHRINDNQPFYALQLPGIQGEREPFDDIPALAAHFVETIQVVQPHGPYYLTGYSITGLVAFEMAQQFLALGERVGLLVLLDTAFYTEQVSEEIRKRQKELKAQRQRRRRQRLIRRLLSLPRYTKQLLTLSADERAIWLKDRQKSLKFTADQELPAHNVGRALEQASERYTIKPYAGSILFFSNRQHRAADNVAVNREDAWAGIAQGGFTIVDVPGQHNLLQEPHVRTVALALEQALDKAYAHAD
ncbi:MAG: amino acid adenylation domain-containing protein [Chloroflexi bacterium]|nr:amino acid adenylation domain-containing protein [Chloroflexota bacterium]